MTNWLVKSIVLILLLPLTAGAAPADARTNILVMGDSISAAYGIQREAGWVALLEARLGALDSPWQVVNASISGETTGGGLARLSNALAAHDPGIVIIELGGNDGLRGYPVAKIRDNLDQLVTLSTAQSRNVLLLGIKIPPNYGPRYTNAFASMYREIAAQRNVPFVPFLLESVALTPTLMQNDGIHPTAEAQPQLLDTIWTELAVMLNR
jgi:acyl-CoA thioesterase-1